MNRLLVSTAHSLEQMQFEDELCALLQMLRPNRRERLEGWAEYRTGGTGFRVTVSWNADHHDAPEGAGGFRVPRIVDVLEALLVGSLSEPDDVDAPREFALYRDVLDQLCRRLCQLEDAQS